MSSIVKKSSQFTPKVKRRSIRRGSAISTPPATQADTSVPPTQDAKPQAPHTPGATQISKAQDAPAASPLLKYALTGGEGLKSAQDPDLDVDPMDTSRRTEEAIEDKSGDSSENENDDYGDNDIFKKPQDMAQRRRSSVAGHRRLSGISAFRRSGSISGTPGSVGPDGEERNVAPVLIGIPISKPVKKRRSSSVVRGVKRLSRSEGSPFTKTADGSFDNREDDLHEEEEDEEAAGDGELADTAGSEAAAEGKLKAQTPSTKRRLTTDAEVEGDFVYGIDPNTNRLTKFKTLASVESDLDVAPANLITTISSLDQLPRKLEKNDWQLLSLIEISDELQMKDLCKPSLPFGSYSDNYKKSVDAQEKIKDNRRIRTAARKLAREQRIPYEEAFKIYLHSRGDVIDTESKGLSLFDEPDEVKSSGGLKVTLVNSQIAVDQESTLVSKRQAAEAGDRVVEIENAFENPITSKSYSKLSHTDTWTDDELKQFYRALSTWGTDFTFIAQMFPYRTRRQIKRKFILEEKNNPQLVELALRRKLPGNFAEFESSALSLKELADIDAMRQLNATREAEGKPTEDIKSRFPTKARFDLEIEELNREHKRHIEEITNERERAIKEDLEASRKREIEFRTGTKPMTRTQMKQEFKKNETVVGTLDHSVGFMEH